MNLLSSVTSHSSRSNVIRALTRWKRLKPDEYEAAMIAYWSDKSYRNGNIQSWLMEKVGVDILMYLPPTPDEEPYTSMRFPSRGCCQE